MSENAKITWNTPSSECMDSGDKVGAWLFGHQRVKERVRYTENTPSTSTASVIAIPMHLLFKFVSYLLSVSLKTKNKEGLHNNK